MPTIARTFWKLAFGLALLSWTPLGNARSQATAMAYPTPLIYYRWWNDVQECVGATRNINEITFRIASVPVWADSLYRGDTLRAVWLAGKYNDNDATVFVGLGWESVPGLVRHEMAHAILHHRNNVHPDSIFHGRCAPLFAHEQNVSDST